MSWLNLMSDTDTSSSRTRVSRERSRDRSLPRVTSERSRDRSLPRLDQVQESVRSRSRAQELCDKWSTLALDIDEILEAPLETNLTVTSANTADRDYKPFIQTEFRPGVVPQGYKAEPLHLFHTIRNRKHVLHCYEYLLMQTLETDDSLWQKLCDRFGYCDQCVMEGCNKRSPKHSHNNTPANKDPFSLNSIHPDLWFLAITLKESKDKLIHFIRSELPKRKEEIFQLPGSKTLSCSSFLSSYLSSFNFVEMYLDSIFRLV